MRWQILIVTQPSRREMLSQLLSLLEPQLAALGLNKFDQVDVLIHETHPNVHVPFPNADIGDIREHVRKKSEGDYINFLDDDDLVAPNYVSSILPLLDGVDQVGFELEMYSGREKMAPVYHSLIHGNWTNPSNGRVGVGNAFCRDISHINPMRRELALQVPMSGGIGEDCRWAQAMRGKVKTEHYIDTGPLYYYLWRPNKRDAVDARDPFRLQMIDRLRIASNCGTKV